MVYCRIKDYWLLYCVYSVMMAAVEKDLALLDECDQGDVTLEVTCPVCFECLTEPVVLPCKHEMCKSCFHQNLTAANFYCPICRRRISSWARKRSANPVDNKRKEQLEAQRKDGSSRCNTVQQCRRSIAKEGEVHEEYLTELRLVEKERKAEEELGRAEALRLENSIAQEELLRREQEEKDRHIAKILDQSYSEEKDRHLAKTLDQSYSKLTSPSRSAVGKAVKKKAGSGQLPITLWLKKFSSEDSAQIETDYKLALELQNSWQSKND